MRLKYKFTVTQDMEVEADNFLAARAELMKINLHHDTMGAGENGAYRIKTAGETKIDTICYMFGRGVSDGDVSQSEA